MKKLSCFSLNHHRYKLRKDFYAIITRLGIDIACFKNNTRAFKTMQNILSMLLLNLKYKTSNKLRKMGLICICCLCLSNAFAETVRLKITYHGKGVAGHTVVVLSGISVFGKGVTDSGGNLVVDGGSLPSKEINLAGGKVFKNGKKEWSIAGEITLDNQNYYHLKMDEVIKDYTGGDGSEKLIAIAWGLTEDSPAAQKEAVNEMINGFDNDPGYDMFLKKSPEKQKSSKSTTQVTSKKVSGKEPTNSTNTSITSDIGQGVKDVNNVLGSIREIRKSGWLAKQKKLENQLALSDGIIKRKEDKYLALKATKNVDPVKLRLAEVQWHQAKLRQQKQALQLKLVNSKLGVQKLSRKEYRSHKASLKKTEETLTQLNDERKRLKAQKKPEEFSKLGLKTKITQLKITLKRKQVTRKVTFRKSKRAKLDQEILAIKTRLKKYQDYLAKQKADKAQKELVKKKNNPED